MTRRRVGLAVVLLFGATWLLPAPTPLSSSTPRQARFGRAADVVALHPAPVLKRAGDRVRQLLDHARASTASSVVAVAVAALLFALDSRRHSRREWWRFVMSRRGPPVTVCSSN